MSYQKVSRSFAFLGVGLLVLCAAGKADVFTDDFTTFDPAKWTQYGGDNIVVNGADYPGMVWVDGANNLEPAARITHHMPTGTGNFRMQVDFKHIGDSGTGQGSFGIGWCVENDFACVEEHQPPYHYQTFWGYGTHVGVNFYSSPPPTKTLRLTGSDQGEGNGWPDIATFQQSAPSDPNGWYTAVVRRTGNLLYGELWLQGTVGVEGAMLGQAQWELPAIRNYQYFHLSTTESICNNAHSYYLVDNVELTTVPEPASVLSLAVGGLVAIRRRGARPFRP